MSEAVSALNHARFDGIVHVEETGLQGMIALRGDLSSPVVKKAVTAAVGAGVPKQREVAFDGTNGVAWMSPDELLLMCPYDQVPEKVADLEKALAGAHSLAVNVSDARAMFAVSGPAAREVLAKLCPVDLSPDAFKPGMIRRTRMAQVPAAFWMDDQGTFRIICFRSVAEYVFGLLKAASAIGSDVGFYRT